MKCKMVVLLVVIGGCVKGGGGWKVKRCVGWMERYEELEGDEKERCMVVWELEGEVKGVDVLSVDEIENGVDVGMMVSGGDKSGERKKEVMYCGGIGEEFVGFENKVWG